MPSVVGDRVRGERRPGPLERAVDRGHGGVEQLRDLAGLPSQDLPQDQHGPLPRGQVLQRRDEREADGLALLGELGRVARPLHRQHAAVGDRLEPGDLRERLAERPVGGSRTPQVHGAGPAFATLQHVEAHVRGDAVQPGAQRRPGLEAVEPPPRPEQRLLDGVLRLEGRAQHPVAVRGQLHPVPLQLGHRLVRPKRLARVLLRRDLVQLPASCGPGSTQYERLSANQSSPHR